MARYGTARLGNLRFKPSRPFGHHRPPLRLAAGALIGFGHGAALVGKVRVDQLARPAFAVAPALGAPIGEGVAEAVHGRRFAGFPVGEPRIAKPAALTRSASPSSTVAR